MEPISIGLPIPTNADLRLRHHRLFNIDRLGHIQNFEGRNCEVRFTFKTRRGQPGLSGPKCANGRALRRRSAIFRRSRCGTMPRSLPHLVIECGWKDGSAKRKPAGVNRRASKTRCNYIFFFFLVLVIGFVMPSVLPLTFGAVASEPDFAAAPPLVPLAPPV
jgi:hypothetical protein